MKKIYIKPTFSITEFENESIITANSLKYDSSTNTAESDTYRNMFDF